MANLVIPAVGAVIGYWIGGPTGAQIGWVAGSAYQSSQETIEQPAIGDLTVQTAQYGVPIKYVVGRQRITGNIIWASEKRTYNIETKSSGKGGGPTTISTGYRMDFAILLCKGPILGISRVWANNSLIIDGRTTQKPLLGNVYYGSADQMPDTVMEAAQGVGNVPAYRGLAYIVCSDVDLGTTGAIPQYSFEVIKAGGFN